MSTLFQPSPILQFQRLFVRLSTLKHEREGLAGAVLATDPHRSTPITTTGLVPFMVSLDSEGGMEMRIAM